MKSIIQVAVIIISIIPSFYLVLGLIKWITSDADTKNVMAARVQIIVSFRSLILFEMIALIVFFFRFHQLVEVCQYYYSWQTC